MTNEIRALVAAIDTLIRKELWFDFRVLKYENDNLVIVGSIDLNYFHTLEIIFKDVFFVSGYFKGWHSDTSSVVFFIPENELELNKQLNIESGNQLFIFKTEDYESDFIVAAENLSFNTNIGLYYNREGLKEHG